MARLKSMKVRSKTRAGRIDKNLLYLSIGFSFNHTWAKDEHATRVIVAGVGPIQKVGPYALPPPAATGTTAACFKRQSTTRVSALENREAAAPGVSERLRRRRHEPLIQSKKCEHIPYIPNNHRWPLPTLAETTQFQKTRRITLDSDAIYRNVPER